METTKNPFTLTFFGFLKLSKEERNTICNEAYKRNKHFNDQYFKKNPDIDWFVIAHKKKNIIIKGNHNNEPLSENLGKLAKKIDKVVFTYSRQLNYCAETEETN
ncbi:MAG: hypothetical protein WC606_03805 [Candidatus Absconditabacterales bacterium]|jgi:hypothetical protein